MVTCYYTSGEMNLQLNYQNIPQILTKEGMNPQYPGAAIFNPTLDSSKLANNDSLLKKR